MLSKKFYIKILIKMRRATAVKPLRSAEKGREKPKEKGSND